MNDTSPAMHPSEPPRRPDGRDDTLTGSTQSFSAFPGPASPPPSAPPPGPFAAPPPKRPGRGRFAAMVLAGALVVGAASGVGGAAVWNAATDDDGSTQSAGQTSSQTAGSPDSAVAPSDGSVQAVAEKVLPSVVKIDVSGRQGSGSGSGIVLSADGQILTNQHVVEVAGQDGTISVSFSDGSRAAAKIVGTDPLTDIAVIQAEDVEDLTPATLGNSTDLKVGEGVVAVGSPYGLDATVTSGIVSALNRPVGVGQDSQGNTTAYPAIQTDAAINPGNSGGPLVDMSGNVVGINSSIRTSGSSSPFGQSNEGGSIGLGFAIPIDAAMPIVEQIADGETPTHARLGITVSDSGGQGSEGAQVREVDAGSAAGKAGLESGDVITKVDDHTVTGADSLIATIRAYRPGDTVTLTFQRGDQTKTADLELGSDAG